MRAMVIKGSGNCSVAWQAEGARLLGVLERALGWRPFAGTLNLRSAERIDWDRPHLRFQMHDLADQTRPASGGWTVHWFRAYRIRVEGVACVALRPDRGEWEFPPPRDLIEVVADEKLRDRLRLADGDTVELELLDAPLC